MNSLKARQTIAKGAADSHRYSPEDDGSGATLGMILLFFIIYAFYYASLQ